MKLNFELMTKNKARKLYVVGKEKQVFFEQKIQFFTISCKASIFLLLQKMFSL